MYTLYIICMYVCMYECMYACMHACMHACMEWNGMEWNGMKWNGMEWNGMEWNETERNGMQWNICMHARTFLQTRNGPFRLFTNRHQTIVLKSNAGSSGSCRKCTRKYYIHGGTHGNTTR